MSVNEGGVSLSKVTLTKAAPSVSLTKSPSGGLLRVNLNWNAKPAGGGGLFHRKAASLDLDLGCLYEFADGSKGAVQALGNAFTASPRALTGTAGPVIRLDGDDRSGESSDGENMFIDLAHAAEIKRILVFAYIYEGAADWSGADGVVTLFPATGPQVEVRLDATDSASRMCAIALLTGTGHGLEVQREVRYINGMHQQLDEAYAWGMSWQAGRK